MNVFASSPCPAESARFLDKSRQNKMLLESTQILSTVLRELGVNDPRLYRATHRNHPCVRWAADKQNFEWLLRHVEALNACFRGRRGTDHKSFALHKVLAGYLGRVPDAQAPFVNCTSDEFRHNPYTHFAYQAYLARKWASDTEKRMSLAQALVDEIKTYSRVRLMLSLKRLTASIQEATEHASRAIQSSAKMTETLAYLQTKCQTSKVKARAAACKELLVSACKSTSILLANVKLLQTLLRRTMDQLLRKEAERKLRAANHLRKEARELLALCS